MSPRPSAFHEREPDHRFLSDEHAQSASGSADATRKRAAKRPTVTSLIKAAQASGLKIVAIKSDGCGVTLMLAGHDKVAEDDEAAEERRWAENLGAARSGRRSRR